MKVLALLLSRTRQLANQAERELVAVARNDGKLRMSIPVGANDSDQIFHNLAQVALLNMELIAILASRFEELRTGHAESCNCGVCHSLSLVEDLAAEVMAE